MKYKKISAAIAFALTLTITATIVALPLAYAHTPPWTVQTFAYVAPAPDPIGVGQTGTIVMWLDKVPVTAFWQYGDRWEGFKIELTDPDGAVETLGPFTSDDIGGYNTRFTPDKVGTWHVKFIFPGYTIQGKNPGPTGTRYPETVGDYYAPSSAETDWVVQEEPVLARPVTPLPTGYWTRPINGMNAEWACIAGDWLNIDPAQNSYNAYTFAPESAHVMWTKPIAFQGVAGGPQAAYDWNYYTGQAYETKFGGVIIMYGRLYFNLPLGTSGSGGGVACWDLRTGEELWTLTNVTSMSFGQNYDFVSPNEFGTKPYLWRTGGSTWDVFDPFTGRWLYSFANATGGTVTQGPKGELMIYILNGQRSWLALWNSSKAIMYYMGLPPTSNQWMWRPQGTTMDWKYGLEWNVTTANYTQPGNQAIWKIDVPAGVILAYTRTGNAPLPWLWLIGYSTKDGHELWHVNRTAPFAGGTIQWVTYQAGGLDGVFVEWYQEKMVWYGYDSKTGNMIWGPTEPYANAWGMYGWQSRCAYGMLLANEFSGAMHAYDLKTGELKWEYFTGTAGWDTPYGVYPSEIPIFEADGKIYITHGHGYSPPIFKGATLDCINATTGELIWDVLSFNNRAGMAIADGYIACYNLYDGQVYSFGRGPSATTVTVGPKITTLGSSVEIEGTVTDECAGAKKLVADGKFKSVAAVSDASQNRWMEYLYMQQPFNNTVTGVEVSLDSVDPNNNFVHIGTATTDTSGTFHFMYEPPVPGEYTVIATFAGSKSYGSSYAETAFGVDEAAPTPETPEIPVPVDNTNLLYGILVGVIAAFITGLVAIFLAIRKK